MKKTLDPPFLSILAWFGLNQKIISRYCPCKSTAGKYPKNEEERVFLRLLLHLHPAEDQRSQFRPLPLIPEIRLSLPSVCLSVCLRPPIFPDFGLSLCRPSPIIFILTLPTGLISCIDTKAKCRHLKNLTVKRLCGMCLS
jgi:hypothetical protein